jgi:hypothetical protein
MEWGGRGAVRLAASGSIDPGMAWCRAPSSDAPLPPGSLARDRRLPGKIVDGGPLCQLKHGPMTDQK